MQSLKFQIKCGASGKNVAAEPGMIEWFHGYAVSLQWGRRDAIGAAMGRQAYCRILHRRHLLCSHPVF